MKIVTEGEKTTWPIGEQFTCPTCNSVFMIEEEDIPQLGRLSGHFFDTKCPHCATLHGYYKPTPLEEPTPAEMVAETESKE